MSNLTKSKQPDIILNNSHPCEKHYYRKHETQIEYTLEMV